VALSQRARAAAILGDADGAADAYERLKPWATYFVVGGTGLVAMHGSTEFTLGCLAASLGKTDAALRHLRSAVAANARAGLPPFEIESQYELAKVLVRRGRREDRSEALVVAGDAARTAAQLGMGPLRTQAEGLIESLQRSTKQSGAITLTGRELEIASLVASGLTNRQIADVVHVAERTAENHVQHILTKLGFQNRAQVAAWATSQHLGDARPT
jgi:DNA-binding CsgD family transcriptional regulator